MASIVTSVPVTAAAAAAAATDPSAAEAETAGGSGSGGAQLQYTCMCCRVGFSDAEPQRRHYKTDWHRYNLKRKVAGMPPLTAEAFAQRVLAQREEDARAAAQQAASFSCALCAKSFASKNAYDNHLPSRKHREAQAAADAKATKPAAHTAGAADAAPAGHSAADTTMTAAAPSTADTTAQDSREQSTEAAAPPPSAPPPPAVAATATATATAEAQHQHDSRQDPAQQRAKYAVLEQAAAREVERIEARVRSGLPEEDPDPNAEPTPDEVLLDTPVLEVGDCIFDDYTSNGDVEQLVKHMSQAHGLFVPNLDYVVDLSGLVRYLQLKVGNYFTCIWCNKSFGSLEAVRAHMEGKGHKQVDYSEKGQDELGEFYDFSSTYPDDARVDDGVRDLVLTDADRRNYALRVLPDTLELQLPSGAKLGHRDLQRYYRQRLKTEDTRESVVIQRVMNQCVIEEEEKGGVGGVEMKSCVLIVLFFLGSLPSGTRCLGTMARHRQCRQRSAATKLGHVAVTSTLRGDMG